jgi:hypothetical protein
MALAIIFQFIIMWPIFIFAVASIVVPIIVVTAIKRKKKLKAMIDAAAHGDKSLSRKSSNIDPESLKEVN